MKVVLGGSPRMRPVFRNAEAPWLGDRSNKFKLTEDWLVWIDGEMYTVPKGYITDGSTIPRVVWWLFPPTYGPAFRAAIFHDWCYSHYHTKVDKLWADKAFKAIMLYDEAPAVVAASFYRAVRMGGSGGWE